MDTIAYNKLMFDYDIRNIINKIKAQGDKFDLIVGINRGGAIPAVVLSHALKIPATMMDYSTRDGANIHPRSLTTYFRDLAVNYKRVLIVDDLVDSGLSIKSVVGYAKQHLTKVSLATLLHNEDVTLEVDHYWGTLYSRKDERRYFDFWWEQYGQE